MVNRQTMKCFNFQEHLLELQENFSSLKKAQKLFKTQPWPPQPDYELQGVFQVWTDIAQETSLRLHLASHPSEYREWVTCKIKEYELNNLATNLAEESFLVLEEIMANSPYEDLSFHPVICGLLATLTYLGHAYRWGTVPAVSQAREESYLEFPPLMVAIWRRIHEHLGISGDGGCVFSLNLLACYRDNMTNAQSITVDETLILPNRKRWRFNYEPEWQKTEENFCLIFAQIEAQGKNIFLKMIECAELINNISPPVVKVETISQINLILNQIADGMELMFSIFFKMQEHDVSSKNWVDAVEVPHTWHINGGTGPSGIQTLVISALDAFFQVQGTSLMYKAGRKNRARMTKFMRQFSVNMDVVGFILRELVKRFPELHNNYNRSIDILTRFRKFHRGKGHKYLSGGRKVSEGTASGILESVMISKADTIASKFREEMYDRIVETENSKINISSNPLKG